MKYVHLTRNVLAAAVIGAMGTAFAQTSATTAAPQASESKPLCSSLNHPNAGKHADKSTGMAKEKSSSPVHMDCVPDSSASTANGTSAAAGTSGTSGTGTAASGTQSATTGVNASGSATASPSVTGSSSTQSSAITGSTTDQNTSITGSSSTFSPNIDLRGRSSLTID